MPPSVSTELAETTLVGHSLIGATVALLVRPRGAGPIRTSVLLAAFAVLANVPDFRLPNWGHERYDISHSVFVSLGLIVPLCAGLLSWRRARRLIGGASVAFGGAAAWLSHVLLDSFYSHGGGIGVLWPLSSARLHLPVPFFDTVHKPLPYFDLHTARVWAVELAFYGTVFALVLIARLALEKIRPHSGRPMTPK
jgi:membrane-bound metal-dependent hydrolase YbcI (DUF457 family)